MTKTAADTIAVVTEDVLADDLASLNLPAAGERDWVEWGQQQTPSRSINEGVNTETELIRAYVVRLYRLGCRTTEHRAAS